VGKRIPSVKPLELTLKATGSVFTEDVALSVSSKSSVNHSLRVNWH
jgi:hypothetical protein